MLATIKRRSRAAGFHLLISATLAAVTGALVFVMWYPGAYQLLAGGRELFLLVTLVDVILGPLLTFAVFDIRKRRAQLQRDLMMIVVLQIAALCYGLHTVYLARPVAMVFEVDRFRVLSMDQVRVVELPEARPEYRRFSLTGPVLVGTRTPRRGAERNDALFMAVDGIDIGQRPSFWRPYTESIPDVRARARPVNLLLQRYPDRKRELEKRLHELGVPADTASFLPVIARGDWVAVIDPAGHISGYLQVDGFL